MGTSIALMIDQRVSEGERIDFFGKEALTTTIPAQFVKKFRCKILKPIDFARNENLKKITADLNKVIEKMILKNPNQWIWTHNRWK